MRQGEAPTSAEDHRLAAVQQHTMLDVVTHGASQNDIFDVSSNGDQIIRRHCMIDALGLLLDNRPFIKIRRHVMRRRSDQLHATRVRLMIGFRALEAGQEAVMNVDDPPRHPFTQSPRQNLHVAGEHHQIDLFGFDDLQQAFFLLGFVVRTNRDVVEGNVVPRRQLVEIAMIRDDGRNFDGQIAGAVTVKQVVQAVPKLRHHNQDTLAPSGVMQLPGHGETVGHLRREIGHQRRLGRPRASSGKMDSQEEQARHPVAKLGAVDDVAAPLRQEAGHREHDADRVGAGDRQDIVGAGVSHRASTIERAQEKGGLRITIRARLHPLDAKGPCPIWEWLKPLLAPAARQCHNALRPTGWQRSASMTSGGKIVGEYTKGKVDKLLTPEASDSGARHRIRHFLENMDAAILEANCEVIGRELPNLNRDSFLRMAVRVAELRADYIRAGIKAAEARRPETTAVAELARLRAAYEEMQSVYEAAERVIERGYVKLA
jgi:hypothetical protein